MDTWHLPPVRVLVGIAATVVAVTVLGARACVAGDEGSDGATTTTAETTTTAVEATVPATSSSIVVLPDWYPKQTSRYSDREPVVTVTTLPPTTSTSTTSTSVARRGTSADTD